VVHTIALLLSSDIDATMTLLKFAKNIRSAYAVEGAKLYTSNLLSCNRNERAAWQGRLSDAERNLTDLREGSGLPGQAREEAAQKLALNRVAAAQKQLEAAEEVGSMLQVPPHCSPPLATPPPLPFPLKGPGGCTCRNYAESLKASNS